MNKKVRNADPKVYKGIKFRSTFELKVYKELEEQKMNFEYEPEKALLLSGFKTVNPFFIDSVQGNSVRKMTYTPDFKVYIGPYKLYIEAKGYCTDRYIVKRKLFLDKIKDDSSAIFAEIHSIRALKNTLIKIRKLCEKS